MESWPPTLNELLHKKVLRFDAETKKWLKNYSWPGNIRELENLIAGSINMTDGEEVLTMRLLPDHYVYQAKRQVNLETTFFKNFSRIVTNCSAPMAGPGQAVKVTRPGRIEAMAFENEERSAIDGCLKKTGGKITAAAELMGISRQLMRYKMKKYNLSRYDYLAKISPPED